jgi:anti-anti-sigma factor
MKIKTGKIREYPSLEISGKITGDCGALITSKIDFICKKYDGAVVVNLSDVTFIDSNGLGALVYLWKKFKEESKQLIFLCGGNFDLDLFATSSLDSLFTIIRSEEEL